MVAPSKKPFRKHVYLRDRMERWNDVLFGWVYLVDGFVKAAAHGLIVLPVLLLIKKIATARARKNLGNENA